MKTIIKFTRIYDLPKMAYIAIIPISLTLLAPTAHAVSQPLKPVELIQLNELPPPWETPRGSLDLSSQDAESSVSYKVQPPTPQAINIPRPAAPNGPFKQTYKGNVQYDQAAQVANHHNIYSPKPATNKPSNQSTSTPEQQYQLGMKYLTGNGVQQNKALANQWLIRSANSGFRDAQFEVFKIYLKLAQNTAGIKKALLYLKKAVDQQLPEAQYTLGKMFMQGTYVVQNQEEGRRWLQQAAQQGHQEAHFLLSQR